MQARVLKQSGPRPSKLDTSMSRARHCCLEGLEPAGGLEKDWCPSTHMPAPEPLSPKPPAEQQCGIGRQMELSSEEHFRVNQVI